MEFMATLKGFRVNGKGANVNFDVPLDDLGSLDGIQTLMGDLVRVSVSPYQLKTSDMQADGDEN